MVLGTLGKNYFQWHYSRAFSDIFNIWKNITTFLFNFFSIPILVKTFFSPWKRLQAEREREGFDLFDSMSTAFVNLIMRIVGMMMRTVLIFFGLCAIAVSVVGGIIFFVLWTFAPFLVVLLCAAGTFLLFQ